MTDSHTDLPELVEGLSCSLLRTEEGMGFDKLSQAGLQDSRAVG
jgi:hypothetical protein